MLRDCPASQTRKLGPKATTFIENQFAFTHELEDESTVAGKTASSGVDMGKEWVIENKLCRRSF